MLSLIGMIAITPIIQRISILSLFTLSSIWQSGQLLVLLNPQNNISMLLKRCPQSGHWLFSRFSINHNTSQQRSSFAGPVCMRLSGQFSLTVHQYGPIIYYLLPGVRFWLNQLNVRRVVIRFPWVLCKQVFILPFAHWVIARPALN